MYWLVVRNGRVIASESAQPRAGAYSSDCEIFEWPVEVFDKPDPRIGNTDILWDIVRTKRDKLLLQSDWTQLNNAPLTATEVLMWSNYRQALRDLTDSYNDPKTIIWPAPPNRK